MKAVASGVVRFEWLALLLAAPFLLFPDPRRTLALMVVPGLWICRRIARGRFIDRTPLNVPILLMTVMVLVSLYATFDIAYSLPKIAGMVLGTGVFYAVVAGTPDRRAWILAGGGFLLAGVAVAALGLAGTNWIHKFGLFESILVRLPARLTGLPGAAEGFHPNEVAGALLWVAPLGCTIAAAGILGMRSLIRTMGRWRAVFVLGALIVMALILVGVLTLTQSRGGWIAAGLVLPISLLALVQGRLRRVGILAIGVVVIAASLWIGLARPHALDPILIGPQEDPGRGTSLETLSARFEIWSRAVYGIEDFAFTGMGMNAFRKVVPVLYPLFSIDPATDIGHAHNTFLQAALDLGIPGLIAYLAIHITAFAMLIATWRRRGRLPFPEPPSRALILGLGGGLAAHLIFGLIDAVALGAKPGILWWALLGLIASLYRGPALRAAHRAPMPVAPAERPLAPPVEAHHLLRQSAIVP